MHLEDGELLARIRAHGEKLITAFQLPPDTNAVWLARELRRVEIAGRRASERYCNGEITEKEFDEFEAGLVRRLVRALPGVDVSTALVLNSDPRGYYLKTPCGRGVCFADVLPRDIAGYGLVAPDLRGWGWG